jgi:hypothetical protein
MEAIPQPWRDYIRASVRVKATAYAPKSPRRDLLFLGGGQAASQRPIHSTTGIGNTAAPLTMPP